MLLNIALLLLVFGAQKKKINPYMAAVLLGIIKAGIYAVFAGNIFVAVTMGVIYAGLTSAFVYFLTRLDKREDSERPEVPTYRSPGAQTTKFKWEYIPLVILLLLIIGGEMVLA